MKTDEHNHEQDETMNMSAPENSGVLFVVTGPSGAGKDSVIARATEMGLQFGSVITTTSRAMRPGESEGHPYHFITQDEFERKVDHNEMIEWATVYGNYYGSTKQEVERALKEYPVVIMKVDPQGAHTLKEMMPEAVVIFIQPPSIEYLRKRLEGRATDAPEIIEQRLAVAESEMADMQQWDVVIQNIEDALDDAAQELIHTIETRVDKK